jgi:hypothetical protein
MTHELLQWVKTAHPYWNRTSGTDHIWLFAHDEGACWAPTEVYENSVILTHWGRMGPHSSGTSYGQVGRAGMRRRRGRSKGRAQEECLLLLAAASVPCSRLAPPTSPNQPTKQLTNQPDNQPTSQPTSQPTNQPTSQPL